MNIKVENKVIRLTHILNELKCGECFRYASGYFMMLNPIASFAAQQCFVFSLDNSECLVMDAYTPVEKVEMKITITRSEYL